jgi:hypothetical protein
MSPSEKSAAFIEAYKMFDGDHDQVCAELGIGRASFYNYKKMYITEAEPKVIVRDDMVPDEPKKELPHVTPEGEADIAMQIMQLLKGGLTIDQVNQIVDKKLEGFGQKYKGITVKTEYDKKKIEGVMPKWGEEAMKLVAIGLGKEPVGQPVIMIGPSGCGKTHVAGMIGAGLDMRFGALSLTAGISESYLTGWYVPTGEGGKFEFIWSQFLDFVANGGLFLLDEADAADANVLVYVHTLLANGYIHIPQLGKDGHIKAHPNFRLICAANTNLNGATREYQGRNALDGATINRLQTGVVLCDYDSSVEAALIDPEILEWGKKIRKGIEKTGVSRILSTRDLINLSVQKASGWKLKDLEKRYQAVWTDEEKKKVQNASAA